MKKETITKNLFKGKTALESAKSALGKLVVLPNFNELKEETGRITQVTIFHENDPKYGDSRIRKQFTPLQEGDVNVGSMGFGHSFLAIKTGGKRKGQGEEACFRIDAVEEVADTPGKLTKALGINKVTYDRVVGINIFANNLIYLMEDEVSVQIDDSRIMEVKDKGSDLVRTLKLV